ncbi:hypothetical protein WAI453_007680 [Rhynchosporium graminicola]
MATASTPNIVVPFILDGRDIQAKRIFEVTAPLTGSRLWLGSAATPADALLAIESCSRAFPAWAQTTPAFRRDIFLRAAAVMEARAAELSEYMQQETGSQAFWAGGFNVPVAADILKDIAGRSTQLGGDAPLLSENGKMAMVLKEPYGVVLGIAPWNAPYILGVRACAAAIMAGNTVILKASELAPRCSWAIGSIFREAGLPPGVLNVIAHSTADAAEVTSTLIQHPAIKKINFTGSTRVGRIIAREAGEYLKPVLLELGGKASCIIMEDADLDEAAKLCIMGGFLHGGQICMSTERILVQASILEQFKSKLQAALTAFLGPETKHAVLVSKDSAAKFRDLISDALSKGATIVASAVAGEAETQVPSTHVGPVILQDISKEMTLYYTESFGPSVTLSSFSDSEEAIRMANDTEYGLRAAIFGKDLSKMLSMAKRIESGAVHINGMTVHDEPGLPHGGVKDSGFGRFGADAGLQEFQTSKTITFR